jgi:hypothetical protein
LLVVQSLVSAASLQTASGKSFPAGEPFTAVSYSRDHEENLIAHSCLLTWFSKEVDYR